MKEEQFIPSESLSKLVLKSNRKDVLYGQINVKFVQEWITRSIEGYLTNLSRRATYVNKEAMVIANADGFVSGIGLELVDRFGIHVNSVKVLEQLHLELMEFVSECERQRQWGTISVIDAAIVLNVGQEDDPVYDLKSITGVEMPLQEQGK